MERYPFKDLPPGCPDPLTHPTELTWWVVDREPAAGPWFGDPHPDDAIPAVMACVAGTWWLYFGPWDGLPRERFRVDAFSLTTRAR